MTDILHFVFSKSKEHAMAHEAMCRNQDVIDSEVIELSNNCSEQGLVDNIDSMVHSFLPGRIRIRHEKLKNDFNQEEIEYLQQQGVDKVSYNKKVGSLLIEYDPNRFSKEEIFSVLQHLAVLLKK
ncbi:MAG: hypothetical protein IK079_01015 [Desulfovibrio sp.]|nr:hypothetical protein [Desulfovibrio sp.]